jgi:hypothetical protein
MSQQASAPTVSVAFAGVVRVYTDPVGHVFCLFAAWPAA